MNELNLKKCLKCGNVAQKIYNNNINGLICCGQEMIELKSNIEDCSIEKHLPVYEIIDNKILVKVNHVMEKEHYISFITLVKGNLQITKFLTCEDIINVEFPYLNGSTIYAYCNKHGLWKCDVD